MKKGTMLSLVIAFSICGFLVIAENSEGTSLSEWKMLGRWLNQTGWDGVTYSTPLHSGTYFIAPAGSNPYGKTAVVNGYAYYPTMSYYLYQLNASNVSQQIANFTAGSSISGSPAVVNGYVYIGSFDDKLYQLNASNVSQQINSYTTLGSIEGSAAVFNGYVYIGSDDDKLYQLNATNISQVYATYQAGSDFGLVSPAIANGYIYVGSVDNKFYQLNASNVSKFIASYTTGDDILSSASVYNGFAYVGSKDGLLYQLNASNVSQRYASFNTSGSINYNNLAIANGYVYTGTNALYQLNASNVSQQIANFSGVAFISGPTYTDGYIYVGNNDNKMYQLNASNVSNVVGYYETGSTIYSSPAIANGYVYFGSWDNKLYQLNATNLSKVEFIAPNVTIISPTSTTYSSSTVSININMSEQGYCNYSLSGIAYSLENSALTGFSGTSPELTNGDYTLTALCYDLAFNSNNTQNVSFTISVSSPSSSSSSSSSSDYSIRSYTISSNSLNVGYSNKLRINDKYLFNLGLVNHTLILNHYNVSSARVTLFSSPVSVNLEKNNLVEIDLENDGINDIYLRYDGSSNGGATIFIKSIIDSEAVLQNDQDQGNLSPSSSNLLKPFSTGIAIILAVILALFFFFKYKKLKDFSH